MTEGRVLKLRKETLQALSAPAIAPKRGFFDEGLKCEVRFSLGFMKPSPALPFAHESAFGASEAGGSFGFADPNSGIGFAYVTSPMGPTLMGDPRFVALREAVYASLPRNPTPEARTRCSAP